MNAAVRSKFETMVRSFISELEDVDCTELEFRDGMRLVLDEVTERLDAAEEDVGWEET